MSNIGSSNIRKIQKSQSTYYVTLPIEEVKNLKWKEKQKVVVERKGKDLIIKDWHK